MKLNELSGAELGRLVNSHEISPVEIIDNTEESINQINESINAFVYTRFDEARDRANQLENRLMKNEDVGPFAGVPAALKDFLPSKKGWTASHGGVRCLKTVDDEDSQFCKAIEQLGGVVVGKTNAPSFGFRGLTDNYMYGPTSTPFKIGYNSGGSSGGSAAAVAAGLVPFAEGGDAGGSIRVPSAWCGVFGFKPSAGIVPSVCRPDAWTATHPYCCGGPITRTVEDAAIILETMMDFDPKDPISVPIVHKQFSNLMNSGIRGMKIGVTHDFDLFPTPDDEIVLAVRDCAKLLREGGAQIHSAHFNIDWSLKEVEQAWLTGICLDTAIDMEIWKKNGFDLDKDHHEDLPEEFFKYNRIALASNAMDYRKFHEIRTNILDSHVSVFEKCDVIIAPVTGCLSVRNARNGDTRGPKVIGGQEVDDLIGFAYTYLENMTGYPAASVPFGFSKEGLPIGVQVIGRRYFDEDVLKVARVIEQLRPWRDSYKRIFND